MGKSVEELAETLTRARIAFDAGPAFDPCRDELTRRMFEFVQRMAWVQRRSDIPTALDEAFIWECKDGERPLVTFGDLREAAAIMRTWRDQAMLGKPGPIAVIALKAVHAAMLRGAEGLEGDYGWNITALNKARPLIRSAITEADSGNRVSGNQDTSALQAALDGKSDV